MGATWILARKISPSQESSLSLLPCKSNISIDSGDYDVDILEGPLFPPHLPCAGPQSPLSALPQAVYPELSIPLPMICSFVASPGYCLRSFLDLSVIPSQPTTSDVSRLPKTLPSWEELCTLLFQKIPQQSPHRHGDHKPLRLHRQPFILEVRGPHGAGAKEAPVIVPYPSPPAPGAGKRRPEGRAHLASHSPCSLRGVT